MKELETNFQMPEYKYYKPDQMVLGKKMSEQLKVGVCLWHSFCWTGQDIFGQATWQRHWHTAKSAPERVTGKINAAFDFLSKVNAPYFTFHDIDVAEEGSNLKETYSNMQMSAEIIAARMQQDNRKLLWGTANLTHNARYAAGAATNPDPEVFCYALAQSKFTLDMTHQLSGEGYTIWGGREGYDTLLNTNLKQEAKQYARFLQLLAEYKEKIGFKGQLYIEPKPCEPMKHQYDFDTATVFAFLQEHGLEKHYKVNIEANHATLAGHTFAHEVAYALSKNIFGSIDLNQGDPQLGWDTDQFPLHTDLLKPMLLELMQHGGFKSGGFNFDTKLRRQSVDEIDLIYAHMGGIDNLAKCLLEVEQIIINGKIADFKNNRYQAWDTNVETNHWAKDIMNSNSDLEALANKFIDSGIEPKVKSGRQEYLENLLFLS